MADVRPPTPAVPKQSLYPQLEQDKTDQPNIAHKEVYDDMVKYLRLKLQKPFNGAKITMLIASGVKMLGKVHNMSDFFVFPVRFDR